MDEVRHEKDGDDDEDEDNEAAIIRKRVANTFINI